MEANAPVANGGWSICLYGERPSSVSRYNAQTEDTLAPSEHRGRCYDHVLGFLKRNHGRKLREVIEC
jgi:hypothetical protein